MVVMGLITHHAAGNWLSAPVQPISRINPSIKSQDGEALGIEAPTSIRLGADEVRDHA